MERIEAVKATGLADEIIVEEYEDKKLMTSESMMLIFLQWVGLGWKI